MSADVGFGARLQRARMLVAKCRQSQAAPEAEERRDGGRLPSYMRHVLRSHLKGFLKEDHEWANSHLRRD
jgi:hypothetical protein